MPRGIPKNKHSAAEELEKDIAGNANASVSTMVEDAVQLPKDGSFVDGDYKITVIKDYDGKVDAFYLSKKDPKYEYRYLADNPENLSRKTGNMLFQGEGWQLCGREHLGRIGIAKEFVSPDGFYRMGDLILSFMPKELYKQKMAHKDEKAKEQNKSIERLLSEGDAGGSFGGGAIHESMKGIQTQKQLGIK